MRRSEATDDERCGGAERTFCDCAVVGWWNGPMTGWRRYPRSVGPAGKQVASVGGNGSRRYLCEEAPAILSLSQGKWPESHVGQEFGHVIGRINSSGGRRGPLRQERPTEESGWLGWSVHGQEILGFASRPNQIFDFDFFSTGNFSGLGPPTLFCDQVASEFTPSDAWLQVVVINPDGGRSRGKMTTTNRRMSFHTHL